MDPLSVATGVAGLLSVALQAGMTIGTYVSAVKNASKDAQRLEVEIQAFSSVLRQLCKFLQSKDADHVAFEPTSVLLVATSSCHKELHSLQKKFDNLSSADRTARVLQRLSWPFTEKETQRTIEGFHRWTQLYSLSLQTAGW